MGFQLPRDFVPNEVEFKHLAADLSPTSTYRISLQVDIAFSGTSTAIKFRGRRAWLDQIDDTRLATSPYHIIIHDMYLCTSQSVLRAEARLTLYPRVVLWCV